MALDIRIPIGLLFTLIGSLLLIYGSVNHTPTNATGGININAAWGAVLIVFGVGMLLLARRHAVRIRTRAG